MPIPVIENYPLLLVVGSNDPNSKICCHIYKQCRRTLQKLYLVSESLTFTNMKQTQRYIFMLAIPDSRNLSERLWDKGLKMNLFYNCCRELLNAVINCWCIHLRQEEQQKENISLNLELYLFVYAPWCYSTIIIWHIGSRPVLCLSYVLILGDLLKDAQKLCEVRSGLQWMSHRSQHGVFKAQPDKYRTQLGTVHGSSVAP